MMSCDRPSDYTMIEGEMAVFADLDERLKSTGLLTRGGFERQSDGLVQTIILVGNLGGKFWSLFKRSGFEGDHALDRWTKSILDPVAQDLGVRIVYPFSKPPAPFLTWAKQAEGLHSSPLGLLIHPDYGLWHAYRAAFVFDKKLNLEAVPPRPSPCDSCLDKPCLSACPVDAFQVDHYDVEGCIAHVSSDQGLSCSQNGCKARQACPVGHQHMYSRKQQYFHMNAFVHRAWA